MTESHNVGIALADAHRFHQERDKALEKLAAHPQAASAEFTRMLTFAKTSERGLAPGGR